MKTTHQKNVSKYLDGAISPEEQTQLECFTAGAKDEEIASLLAAEWEKYDKKEPGYNRFKQVNRTIKGNQPLAFSRFVEVAIRIAAFFLLTLSIGMAFYYHANTQQLEKHVAQELTISVERGERARMHLPDGSTVLLNSFSSVSYPSNFGMKNRTVKLNGEAFFAVAKDANHPFVVETNNLTIKVLGTEFNVSSYNDATHTEASLLEGSIEATTKGEKPQTIRLSPQEKLIVNHHNGTAHVEKTDLFYEMAWMSGELIFRSATFEEMAPKLEHFYGVRIKISGTGNQKERFTGSFKEDNLADVLRILQLHYGFVFQIKGSDVEIRF